MHTYHLSIQTYDLLLQTQNTICSLFTNKRIRFTAKLSFQKCMNLNASLHACMVFCIFFKPRSQIKGICPMVNSLSTFRHDVKQSNCVPGHPFWKCHSIKDIIKSIQINPFYLYIFLNTQQIAGLRYLPATHDKLVLSTRVLG